MYNTIAFDPLPECTVLQAELPLYLHDTQQVLISTLVIVDLAYNPPLLKKKKELETKFQKERGVILV